ncbi:tRNA dihydrouridine synthase DusB [Candidatus Obscuribacterales bacterium]|nr:tRNA dihydrouridine synthase DusB [Candidatus Obscuribacterales bacterium]MBX3137723.1 tRNA dihydrouridine synthase DusB [Candidatus Obscuribacterales bacterium]MBX3148540.1 tRNA dihydrouridine synthase DusB [Candidatus Obscuribacterales bacterium]
MPIKIGSLTVPGRVYVPPMAGVTDLVFRNIVRRVDRGCLLATEMVSSKSLQFKSDSRLMDLASDEHPIGIQIFGHEPEVMAMAAKMAEERGADFVDINMGCPVPKITNGKDGCALMREPDLAKEIVTAIHSSVKIPVTVKFRLGWDESTKNCVEFGEMLEGAGAAAVTVHGRTRAQRYAGNADWTMIAFVKKALSIPVFGNGDVFEPEDAARLLEATNCDGVAVARGTLGNPWLIPRITKYLDTGILDETPDVVDRLILAMHHCIGMIAYKGIRVGTSESRRHLINYTKGIHKSAPYRNRLTQVNSAREIVDVLAELVEQEAGMDGKRRFLSAVERYDIENIGKFDEGNNGPEAALKALGSAPLLVGAGR